MHPARATQKTWNMALDEAVQNGLNLITIYVMWSEHQPFPNMDIDWSFPQSISCRSLDYPTQSCDWNLANAIRAAGDRGLFVHLRLGPYSCAEYSYGGLPEWLPLQNPEIRLRRPNREWLEVMETWVA
jgi:beta-galactosidase GanA